MIVSPVWPELMRLDENSLSLALSVLTTHICVYNWSYSLYHL